MTGAQGSEKAKAPADTGASLGLMQVDGDTRPTVNGNNTQVSQGNARMTGKESPMDASHMVAHVAALRNVRSEAAKVLSEKQSEFAVANKDLLDGVRELTNKITMAEEALKAVVERGWKPGDEKKVLPGVEIKLFKEYKIDEERGLQWAIEKNMCLVPQSLDVPAVKKIATVMDLPFVEVAEVPKAQIATDLNKALLKAAEPAAEEVAEAIAS